MRRRLISLISSSVVAGVLAIAAAVAANGNVDELHFGTMLDAQGVVPAKSHENEFVPNVAIHASMTVQKAPKDTTLMLSIFDRETQELVWTDEQRVPGGHANMHFTIAAGKLNPGKYKAKVKLGPDWVAEHEFQVK